MQAQEKINEHLSASSHREVYSAAEVQDMLLDIALLLTMEAEGVGRETAGISDSTS